jgi:hypothetical protein
MTKSRYTARSKLRPADGQRWQKYFAWAKIPALKEVVSLDVLCCRHLIETLTDEDWEHHDQTDFRFGFFNDPDYLVSRVGGPEGKNILGVYIKPESHITTPPAAGFVFLGYDLVEDATEISVLVGCAGFPDAFSNAELNQYGLIHDYDRALAVRELLKKRYPDEPHADCSHYAIWRLEPLAAQ